MAQIMPKFHLAFGGAEPCARLGEHRSPPGPYFSMKKSSKRNLDQVFGRLRRRGVLQKVFICTPPGVGLLFCEEK